MKLDLFAVIIITIVAVLAVYAVYIQIKTKKSGYEAEAVVVDVAESWDRTGDDYFLEYKYTVEYTNYEGQTVTAALGGLTRSNKHLEVGDRIKIKYLKNKQEYPIMVK